MLGIRVGSEELGIGAGVPSGVSAAVLIGGTNDMTIAQKMGARWEVRDPDGIVVDSYFDWEMFSTPPGQEHGFVGNQFSLDKLGTYTVRAELLMNPDDPVTVDSYDGALCVVIEAPPTEELIQHTIYPYSYVYDGDVEGTTAVFKTDPFTPSAWAAQRFADALEDEVAKAGGRVLELQVYVDTTPLLWTDFRVEVISTPLEAAVGGGVGVAVGIPVWAAILIIALAIVAVIVAITLSVKTIVSTFTRKPLSEEIKITWSRETLITIIGDFEEKQERPPTPPERLEEMSDGELREYCDQLAEAIVPAEVEWMGLVVVGGIALLGMGAVAVVFAARKT